MNEIRTLEVEVSRKEMVECDQDYLNQLLKDKMAKWGEELMDEGLDMFESFTIEEVPDYVHLDTYKVLISVQVSPSTEPEVTVDWDGPPVLPGLSDG